MTHLVPLLTLYTLLAASPAAAAPDDASAGSESVPTRARPHLPPLRLESRVVVREMTNPGLLVEGAVQVHRTERLTFDLGVAYTGHHALGMTGPWRTIGSLDGLFDAQLELGPWISTGPSAGVAYRFYRQQWTSIAEVWTPLAGWRANASLIRARRWSLVLSTKVMVDLLRTDLVRETAEIVRLSRVEGQVGLRLHFGHGRVR